MNIPERNNVYATIFNVDSKAALANMFAANGWIVRKSTWTDFEMRTDWAELIMEGDDKNPFVNGAIDPGTLVQFREFLNALSVTYSFEFYNEEGTLLQVDSGQNISPLHE